MIAFIEFNQINNNRSTFIQPDAIDAVIDQIDGSQIVLSNGSLIAIRENSETVFKKIAELTKKIEEMKLHETNQMVEKAASSFHKVFAPLGQMGGMLSSCEKRPDNADDTHQVACQLPCNHEGECDFYWRNPATDQVEKW